ncbi:MAG TPA: SIMPL domain-containing protein [Candidatus Moranbacteria bacterium]|nr:SIMPL domain-containing protein [Candidatus Moranbacteria bacterium]
MEEINIKKEFDKKKYGFFLILAGIALIAIVVVVSLLREKIINPNQNQITVYGQGKVEYKPDTATITLGVRVDKAVSASEALNQLNIKIKKIDDAVLALGISADDIKTQNYNLYPAYEYKDGTSKVSGYNANQSLSIKVRKVDENVDLVNRVVSVSGDSGTNEIQGVNYYIDDLNSLKQKARVLAIADARSKAKDLAKAAGIKKLGKVVSWYEDMSPIGDSNAVSIEGAMDGGMGIGGASPKAMPSQISSGTQDITVGMGVNFEVK